MIQSESINDLATALSLAQSEMENAPLNKTNPHFRSKYADLAAIRLATLPPLNKHGLSIYQATQIDGDFFLLVTRLAHKSGQWIESVYPIPMITDKPQVMGSALTYARRYSWASICGVASEEDNDANAAQEGAKNGNSQPKRTKAEISADADFKRKEAKRVQDDVNQITSFVALDKYKREVLTPEFMARLGNGQWGIEEMFRRREEELMRDAPAVEAAPPPTDADWLERMQQATTKDDLLKVGADIESETPDAVDRLLPAFKERMKTLKAVHA